MSVVWTTEAGSLAAARVPLVSRLASVVEGTVAQLATVPLVVRYLPELLVCDGNTEAASLASSAVWRPETLEMARLLMAEPSPVMMPVAVRLLALTSPSVVSPEPLMLVEKVLSVRLSELAARMVCGAPRASLNTRLVPVGSPAHDAFDQYAAATAAAVRLSAMP